ncbi:MAG TPA: 4-hydroxythreonine-4-phosphate dehydrogenase PdxA [Polyangiaceae bacterium]|jgi:4-hydroxythreonine-4-phosphate dehydrogenase
MSSRARSKKAPKTTSSRRAKRHEAPLLVVSTGCPAGIGPEVCVAAAVLERRRVLLVGDAATLHAAAELRRVRRSLLAPVNDAAVPRGKIGILQAGELLAEHDRRAGRPSKRAGRAQLEYIDVAHALCLAEPGRVLVTGPVSKWAISRSGKKGQHFIGHTEWLCAKEGGEMTVMCFAAERFSTSLVTTHLPLSRVSAALSAAGVARAVVALSRLLAALGCRRPKIAVCSFNPHAGEQGMFGGEERAAIAPGVRRAERELGAAARLYGPLGAETAFRKAAAGEYDGVVAMYHDQATIPMKLVSFGDAVNVTVGLRVVRTSVDHGTGYDIAWSGKADPGGMLAALRLGERLSGKL